MIDVQGGKLETGLVGQAPQHVDQHHRIDTAAQPRDKAVTATDVLADYRGNARPQIPTWRRFP